MVIRIEFKTAESDPIELELVGEIKVRKYQEAGDMHAFLDISAPINTSNLEAIWGILQEIDVLTIANVSITKETKKIITVTNPINLTYTKVLGSEDKEYIQAEE